MPLPSETQYATYKCSVESREIHWQAGCPPGSPPHKQARGKNSSSSDRAGLREATEGVVKAVECIRTGTSSSLLFLARGMFSVDNCFVKSDLS